MIYLDKTCAHVKAAQAEALAAKDAEIAALQKLLQRVRDWDEDEPLGGSQLLDSIRAALEISGGVK